MKKDKLKKGKKGYICDFANLVHVGGTETMMCYACSFKRQN